MGRRSETWNPDRIYVSVFSKQKNKGIKVFETPAEFCDWLRSKGESKAANDDYYDLTFAKFTDIDLTGLKINASRMSNSRLTGATFDHADLHGADLSYAEMGKVKAMTTLFNRAKMKGVQAEGAVFARSSFVKTFMGAANFDRSDMRCVDLSDANLADSTFRGADLRGAIMNGASVEGVDFSDALIDIGQLKETKGRMLSSGVNARNLVRLKKKCPAL